MLLLILSILFVAAGLGMIVTGADGGITTTAFFGVCAAVAVWQMWPGLLETETRSADALLARYPGPVVLRASTRKLLFLAALSTVFGGVMLWMLLHEAVPLAAQVLVWPGVVLFLGGAPVMIAMAIKGSALHLDGVDLTIVRAGRLRRVRWHDASGFTAVAVSGAAQRIVMFDDASAGETRLAAMNRQLTGRGVGLPDTYGLEPEALADLLAAWRMRAVSGKRRRLPDADRT
ncbi:MULTISPECIES: hypothetical protein [Methylobacterium]|uniref:hypothetical protein n=1 Tax=Methylobacterium TaxID=407 RepID=UPI001FAD5715|nr:hypothetical protein [Methylobacterium sp. Leaf104]